MVVQKTMTFQGSEGKPNKTEMSFYSRCHKEVGGTRPCERRPGVRTQSGPQELWEAIGRYFNRKDQIEVPYRSLWARYYGEQDYRKDGYQGGKPLLKYLHVTGLCCQIIGFDSFRKLWKSSMIFGGSGGGGGIVIMGRKLRVLTVMWTC